MAGFFSKEKVINKVVSLPVDKIVHNPAQPRQNFAEEDLRELADSIRENGVLQPITVRRGAGGGYLLTREPEEYTVGEILRVLEGNLAPVSCADADDVCRCGRADRCVTVEIWREIQAAVSGVVDHVTLADLVRRHQEKCPESCENAD